MSEHSHLGAGSSAWTRDLAGAISSPWHGRLPAATVLGLTPLFLSEDACLQSACLFGSGPVSTERWGGFSALRPTAPELWVPCPSRGLAGGQRGALADPWPWATESGLLQPLHSSGISFNCPAFNKVVLSLQVYGSYSPCLSTSCKSLESPPDL